MAYNITFLRRTLSLGNNNSAISYCSVGLSLALIVVEWNLSIKDTIGTGKTVLLERCPHSKG